jgi:hypothetical protein
MSQYQRKNLMICQEVDDFGFSFYSCSFEGGVSIEHSTETAGFGRLCQELPARDNLCLNVTNREGISNGVVELFTLLFFMDDEFKEISRTMVTHDCLNYPGHLDYSRSISVTGNRY